MAGKGKKEIYQVSEEEQQRRLGRYAPKADCSTCYLKRECESAQEGSFCTKWAQTDPAEKRRGQRDPGDAWRLGDEFEE